MHGDKDIVRDFLIRASLPVAFVALAYVVRSALEPWLSDRAQFLLFVPAVLLSAILAGRSSALLATAISLPAAADFFPSETFGTPPAQTQMFVFIIISLGITLLAQHLALAHEVSNQYKAKAEEELRHANEASESLRLLLESAAEYAIFMMDQAGNVSLWTSGGEHVYGWKEAEILGKHCSVFYPKEEAGKAQQDLDFALSKNGYHGEILQIRKSGSEFLGEIMITPMRTDTGELRGFAKVVRDITARRAAAEALERREQHLRSILSTIPEAMVVVDDNARITSFSAAAERLFVYDEADVVGKHVSILTPGEFRETNRRFLSRYLETKEPPIIGFPHYMRGCRSDGTTFPMRLTIGEAATEDVRLFTGFVEDLTEKRRLEEQMEQLTSELTQASRLTAMGAMASTLAHELNQPLTAIGSFAEAAERILEQPGDTKKKAKQLLREVAGQSYRAGEIVRRLRNFVKPGNGWKAEVILPALIDEAAMLALIGTRERGIESSFHYDREARLVIADKIQIQQVIINLIRNAIDAMEGCPVRRLTITTKREGATEVRVTVTDTGRGLSPNAAEHLFTAFESTKPDGMGLGLSICRTIVEAHGGHISALPAKGGGMKFAFTLPLRTEPKARAQAA